MPPTLIKFIYSEKAMQFCEISTVGLSNVCNGQIYGGDFAKFCGLIRIYELYYSPSYPGFSDLPTALLLNCELIDGV